MIGSKLTIINGIGGCAEEPIIKLMKSGSVQARCKIPNKNVAAFKELNSFNVRAYMVAAK